MTEQDFQKQVNEGYQVINNRWMRFHLRLLVYYTVLSGILEIAMFFVIYKNGTLTCSIGLYWVKYVIAPIFLNFCIMLIGYASFQNNKLSVVAKQYIISMIFVLLAFVLELIHSGFVAVLATAIFPILVTIMYENRSLTGYVAVCTVVLQFISGYIIFWDPDKVLDSAYLINLIVLVVVTLCTWLTCVIMIAFMKMKRRIIINNDMERVQLQRKVNIDGLTEVGNKLALMTQLEDGLSGDKGFHYLAMLDLDEFKNINDTYGHMFGDDVLRCLGEALRAMGVGTMAYRYGGDEFCIIFKESSLIEVYRQIEEVQRYLKKHIRMPDNGMKVQISVGIAHCFHGKSQQELLRQADEALYASKRKGGGGITVYEENGHRKEVRE